MTVETKVVERSTVLDPLQAFALAYAWAQQGYMPLDPLTAFVVAYERAVLASLARL